MNWLLHGRFLHSKLSTQHLLFTHSYKHFFLHKSNIHTHSSESSWSANCRPEQQGPNLQPSISWTTATPECGRTLSAPWYGMFSWNTGLLHCVHTLGGSKWVFFIIYKRRRNFYWFIVCVRTLVYLPFTFSSLVAQCKMWLPGYRSA